MPDPEKPEGENEETPDAAVISAFHRAVEDGCDRLERSWLNLFVTGTVGGIDVSLGVLALLVIEEATGSKLLGALGFPIGFIALTLARSELFEENFLVPITAVVARKSSLRALIRLWTVTAVMNLVGGWVLAWLIVNALPELHKTAVEISNFYLGLSLWEAAALGVIAGAVITLMTWMEHTSETEIGRIVAVVSGAFLLAAAQMNHVIIMSIEMFVALHVGAPFGYADWAREAVLATAANMVGGLLFVTFFRLVQAVETKNKEEQSEGVTPKPEGAAPKKKGVSRKKKVRGKKT